MRRETLLVRCLLQSSFAKSTELLLSYLCGWRFSIINRAEAFVSGQMAVRGKEGNYSDSDRISLLPEGLREKILVCLPLKEAAKTSVLSKNWRYIWTQLPELHFDMSLCDRSVIRQDMSKYMLIISEVLLRHTGSIHKFTLSLYRQPNSDIDYIAHFVCNNAMKDFNLEVLMGEHYRVGAPIFSCSQLENLYLRCCMFRPPPGFSGFGMLTSLKFSNVKITGEVCSDLISCCPQLEKLTLEMLKSCGHLDIVAPNLRFFRWDGDFVALCFKETPQMETLLIFLLEFPHQRIAAERVGEEEMAAAFDGLPALKYVELTSSFLKYMIRGTVFNRFQNDLAHLKAIKLYDAAFEDIDEAKRVLCLLRSSPNLEKITVNVWSKTVDFEPALEALRIGGLSDFTLNKLRKVVITWVTGYQPELLLIEILLANAPVLEEMVIDPFVLLTEEDSSIILGKLMQFRRASPSVCIKYYDPPN